MYEIFQIFQTREGFTDAKTLKESFDDLWLIFFHSSHLVPIVLKEKPKKGNLSVCHRLYLVGCGLRNVDDHSWL